MHKCECTQILNLLSPDIKTNRRDNEVYIILTFNFIWSFLSSNLGFECPLNALEFLIPSAAFLPCKTFVDEIFSIISVQSASPVNEPASSWKTEL